MPKYRLKWTGGRSAQLEIFSPPGFVQRQFLKYSPALRPSLRTVQECLAASTSLQMANVELDNAVQGLRAVGLVPLSAAPIPPVQPAPAVAAAPAVAPVLQSLEQAGMALSDFVANSPAEADLRLPGLFLELGTDEALVNYPWELLHDGDDFLCLKHYVGRYVNTSRISAPRMQPSSAPAEYDKIRVLLISVPGPPGCSYLPGAQAETVSLVQALGAMPQVEVTLMKAPQATVLNVRSEIKSGQYQIVHFCGHATFDSVDPRRSALMLADRPLEAGLILVHLKSVILSFINACETAQQAGPPATAWEAEFNTFSLARAFMEAESYLLGSRWKLSDKAAPAFATSFYKALLEDLKPIGEAVVAARKACRQGSAPDDVGWASYVYFGDPRLGFEAVP